MRTNINIHNVSNISVINGYEGGNVIENGISDSGGSYHKR